MRILQLANEYPPHVYGGAGVHLEYLARELARADQGAHEIDVIAFGDHDRRDGNLRVRGVKPATPITANDPRHAKLLDALQRDLLMAACAEPSDIVHAHTWYAHLAGCLVRQLTGARLVLTTHSLEPHRPWKAEQLGTAYNATVWIEQTAYRTADAVIAVSNAMAEDVQQLYGVPRERVHVVPNGIDPDEYQARPDPELLRRHGIDPERPFLLFVGRITRQKGIIHLVDALARLGSDVQAVLCAGAPDTEEIGREMTEHVESARRRSHARIIWIDEMLPREQVISLYTHASLFVCPSVYEPFGIINLEAMACETAVVATAVGGIPEIVVEDETGLLVPFEPEPGGSEPEVPERLAADLAAAIEQALADPERLARMGRAGRERVERHFSWRAVAEQTLDVYRMITERAAAAGRA
jgi:glycogen synthase